MSKQYGTTREVRRALVSLHLPDWAFARDQVAHSSGEIAKPALQCNSGPGGYLTFPRHASGWPSHSRCKPIRVALSWI